MKTSLTISLLSVVVFNAACHGRQGESVASTIVAGKAPCGTTVEGIDVSTWREVVATDFTFCVPAEWRVRGRDARQGSSTLKWGPGAPPRATLLGRSTGPVPGPTVSASSFDLRNFSEEIGGQLAQLLRGRYGDDRYYSSATWATPAVWLTGTSRTARDTDLQIAIYRTVRFIP